MSTKRKNPSLAERLQEAEVYEEFCDLMFGLGERYEDLLETLEQWGISSSLGGLHRFSESERSPYTLMRAKREYEAMLANEEVDLDKVQRQTVAEKLYNLATSPHISEKALLKMRDQEIQLEKLKQNDRRIVLLENKMQEASETLEDANLSFEDRVAKMKEIFGR